MGIMPVYVVMTKSQSGEVNASLVFSKESAAVEYVERVSKNVPDYFCWYEKTDFLADSNLEQIER